MCFASAVVSAPGVTPDLEDSPDVLTWMWMLRGVGGEGVRVARPAFNWVAFFEESTEETRWRLGRVDVRGLHLSVGRGLLVEVEEREGERRECREEGGLKGEMKGGRDQEEIEMEMEMKRGR